MSFPVSPSDSDIATFNGADYIYVASKNAWVKTPLSYTVPQDLSDLTDTGGLLGGSSGVTTYATLSELDATGNVAGSMGYVTATGNFYINNGTLWNKVISLIGTEPDEPTIVIATAFGDFAAYVDFTAPTYTGDTVITSYTATSDPAGGSDTLNQSGSGIITVTGLTESTTYTFTITATNSAGTSLPSAASNSITTYERPPGTQKAIFGFGYGYASGVVSITNKVLNTGVVGDDTTGVGTERNSLAAAGYGGDKAIFGYGTAIYPTMLSMTNLVSNTGVVATDTAGVGTARRQLAAAGYGGDKALFGYGYTIASSQGVSNSMTNKVSNTGVVANDTTGVGTVREGLAAAGYGGDKAIFGYGYSTYLYNQGSVTGYVLMTNKVSNTGVVATDTATEYGFGVGTARWGLAAASYGGDKALFGYGSNGSNLSITNLVSNTGVTANNTTGVGTARYYLAAAGYNGDKAIFGYGNALIGGTSTNVSITNLVSNTGVVASDTTGVGTGRQGLAAAGFSLS